MPAKSLRIATWNVNSVRLRLPGVQRLADEYAPDVLALQEIKVETSKFPSSFFEDLGYVHQAVNGIPGYHGVATLSRVPFAETEMREWCGQADGRHVAVRIRDTQIHNFYVPAGGDVPDTTENPKFAHKMDFLAEMTAWTAEKAHGDTSVLVGDLNVAPAETDVWSHRQLLKVVSHTPEEVSALNGIRDAGAWTDAVRHFIPEEEKLFSWWSYRSRDWSASDRGRRLDHVWVTPALVPHLKSATVLREARGWEKPSDHVPTIVDISA